MSGLIEAYKGLITSQHRGKPKFMSTVAALLQFGEDIYATGVYMDEEFDIDIAVGAQEDVLGILVGASRELRFQPKTQATATLNDEDYRILLKAKVAKNLWKGGINDLQTIWYSLFGEDIVIKDFQDMSIEVEITNVPSSVVQEMILQGYIVPKPQSVRMNYHLIRKLDSKFWIGGGASQQTKAVIRMEYAKGASINCKVYYGGGASQHTGAKIRQENSHGGTVRTTQYYGAAPSQHTKTVLGEPRIRPKTVLVQTFYGAKPSMHFSYRVRQPYDDGGTTVSTHYYGTTSTRHIRFDVRQPYDDGGATSQTTYYGTRGSIHHKTQVSTVPTN